MIEQAREVGGLLAVGQVADLQLRLATRGTRTVLGHGHRRVLAHDVTAQVDPGPPFELQAQAGHLRQGPLERPRIGGREQDQAHPETAGMRGQPAEQRLMG